MAAPFLLLLLLAAQASPVGHYRLQHQMETASELELKADGSFEYALEQGALDEYASGRWRRDGARLLLTTQPKPVPPLFSAGTATHSDAAPLALHVTSPDGHGMAGIDFKVTFATGAPIVDYTHSDDGWTMPADERRRPVSVQLALPIYGLVSPVFPIDPARANDLVFILTPNDLGRVDFEDLPLDVAPGRLVMHRGGADLVYLPVPR
jgi:hypothetical protein